MTVVPAWVSPGYLDDEFALSLLDTAMRHPSLIAGRLKVRTSNPVRGRTELVRSFLRDHRAPWFWSLDADMSWRPDQLRELLSHADADERPIVGARYVAEDGRCTWRTVDAGGFHAADGKPGERTELAAVGLGFTLIHRWVLTEMAAEFKDDPWPWFGSDVIEFADGRERVGDDISFCLRARRCGFPVFGAGVTVGHRKTVSLT